MESGLNNFLDTIAFTAAIRSKKAVVFIYTFKDDEFCFHSAFGLEGPVKNRIAEGLASLSEKSLDEENWRRVVAENLGVLSLIEGFAFGLVGGDYVGRLIIADFDATGLTEEERITVFELAQQAGKLIENIEKDKVILLKNRTLLETIEKLEVMQQANNIGTWELDIVTGETFWSEEVYRIHEVPLDFNHHKESALNFYHPNSKSIIIDAIDRAISRNETFNVICELITAKNNRRWVKSAGKRIGNKLIGSFQDITAIKSRELQFEGVFNSSMSFVGILDAEGVLIEINDTALSVGGLTPAQLIGRHFWDSPFWDNSPLNAIAARDHFKTALKGKEISYEVTIAIANQKTSVILFSLRPVLNGQKEVAYVIAEGRPVDELVRTRDHYKAVIEATEAGTWEWNIETGDIVINDRWADFIGYKPEELYPMTIDKWSKLCFAEDFKITKQRLHQCLTQTELFFETETRVKHKDGHWVWILNRGKVIEYDIKGRAISMLGTSTDISVRKAREEAIRISEESFRGNFESAAIGMALLDERGRWLRINSKLTDILGYLEEELLELDFQGITHPDDLDGDLIVLQDLINGKINSYQLEKRYIHKNKSVVYAILAVSVVRNADGEILYFISQIIDVTENKLQSELLEYQRNLLSALYNQSPIGIALNEFSTGKFIEVNDKLVEPTGYTKEEFLSLNYWDITPMVYEKLEHEALSQLTEKGYYDKFEKEHVRKDGTRYPVSLQGVLINDQRGNKLIWSFVQDISKEKLAEFQLRSAVNHLQTILDASKQVSIIATDRSGLITLFNSGAEQMLGYESSHLVGKYTPMLIHDHREVEEEAKLLSEKYGKSITGFEVFIYEISRGGPLTKEWTYKTKSGSQIPVLLSISAIYDADQIIGYLGVAVDITQLKQIENEIRSLLDIAKEQNERLKNFAHIVSHNLRSHSSGITGLMSIIQAQYQDIAEDEPIKLLAKGTENLRKTVEDLTEVVKVNLTKTPKTSIRLYDLVVKNIESLSHQIKESKINVLNQIDENLEVKGVVAYVDSFILNFITNAIKYRSVERDSFLKIYANVHFDTIEIIFEDNGLGIDLDLYQQDLFKMYKTFHQHADSRGVGLFITKNQIESMGGKISVNSELGKGTSFKVSLKR